MALMFDNTTDALRYHTLLVQELGHDNTLTAMAASELSAHLDGIPPLNNQEQ